MASNDIRMRVLLNVEGKTAVAEVTSSVRERARPASDAIYMLCAWSKRLVWK